MSVATATKLVLVMFLWAICFPLITAGLGAAPHLTFAAMRAFLAGGSLLILGWALQRRLPTDSRVWVLLAVVGFGATTLAFLGMFHAAEFVSPGVATVVANTQPIMAAVLAHALLGERLDRKGRVGLALAFLGILLIASPGLFITTRAGSVLGFAYIVLAASGITVSNVLIKRLAGSVDPLMAMGAQLALGGLPLAIAAMLTESPASTQWSGEFLLVLAALALLGTSLVYWLWFSLLETVELNRANAFTFLIPLFGVAMGVALFGETFGWLELIGAGLTLWGLDLVVRRPPRALAVG